MFACVGGMRSVCAARLSQKLPGYALGRMRPVREARGLPEHEIKEFGYALGMLRSKFGLLLVFTKWLK